MITTISCISKSQRIHRDTAAKRYPYSHLGMVRVVAQPPYELDMSCPIIRELAIAWRRAREVANGSADYVYLALHRLTRSTVARSVLAAVLEELGCELIEISRGRRKARVPRSLLDMPIEYALAAAARGISPDLRRRPYTAPA